ncbi:LCP family protein [Thermobifida halotolerans]|uniref:LCP family protein n=1 Tax=Thermobifida halotolerans TaxID=483545 RepID=UPI000A8978B5|nr:LCP family protein [Thermobifida halotolerans]
MARKRSAGSRAVGRRGRSRALPRPSAGQWVAYVTTALVIAASLTAYGGYYSVSGSITTAHVDTDAWTDRPPTVEGVHNILLMGADVRTGDNAEYGMVEGIRPDVTIIASIDADRGAVTLVNLPRDLMVDIPACDPAGDGFPGTSGTFDQLNHAMMYGGVECQWKTVEALTGVHLDHFVLVDFVGFREIVDAVGGVPMCIPEPIDDPKAKLQLEAGEQVLDGEQALGLARSRDSTEFGSDLGRIETQQRLMGAIVRKVTGGDLLSSSANVYAFLNAIADAMMTDDELTVDAMAELAFAVRTVDLERISFVTPPVRDYPANPAKVVLVEEPANRLFDAVGAGEVLPEEESGGGEPPGVDPADVSVRVRNSTAVDGLAARTAEELRALGFTVPEVGAPLSRLPSTTTVYHGPGREDAARTLAAALTTATVEEVPDLGDDLELVITDDWGGVAGGDGSEEPVTEELGGTTAASDEEADACG